jgi:ribosomal-protein-alanine N-acetyltransferase
MTEIRACRPEDLSRLRTIQQQALAEPWPELLETAAHGPPACHVIGDGDPLGYAIVVAEEEGVAYVPELAIHPAEQGQGLGSELLEWLCETLAGTGYTELRLTVQADDERARNFYDHHGFERRERLAGHFESGDGLLLVRPLDAKYSELRGRPNPNACWLFDELAGAGSDHLPDATLGGHVEDALAQFPVEYDRRRDVLGALDDVERVVDASRLDDGELGIE